MTEEGLADNDDKHGGGSVRGWPSGNAGDYSQDRQDRAREEAEQLQKDRADYENLCNNFNTNASLFSSQGSINHTLHDKSKLTETRDAFSYDSEPSEEQLLYIVKNAERKGWSCLYASDAKGRFDPDTAIRLQQIVMREGLSDKLAVSLDGQTVEAPFMRRLREAANAQKAPGMDSW
jgi:Predicted metal-dependent RNase, consists of a metallo-beta-lactamase domain and an RNA-binding KH domain